MEIHKQNNSNQRLKGNRQKMRLNTLKLNISVKCQKQGRLKKSASLFVFKLFFPEGKKKNLEN